MSVSPARLIFTTANWDTAQTVTVTAVADDDATGERITIRHGVSGYVGVSFGDVVTISVTDSDTASLILSPTTLEMTEGSANGTYTVSLSAKPTGNVTITPPVTTAAR